MYNFWICVEKNLKKKIICSAATEKLETKDTNFRIIILFLPAVVGVDQERMSLETLSFAPPVFRRWVSVAQRGDHVLYRHTGRGRGLDRWEEPAAGAETDSTDATEDAYCKSSNAFTHTHTRKHAHTHQAGWKKKQGRDKGDSFNCDASSLNLREKQTTTRTNAVLVVWISGFQWREAEMLFKMK